jgi:AcrR family transcriptional regulator
VRRVTALPPEAAPAAPRTAGKGERTRDHIVETALRLFRETGYEATTMRAIAAAAGVSVGNAYYYFPSKQHLVQAYYGRSQDEHLAAADPVLASQTAFGARLLGVLLARVDTMQSDKGFAIDFFRYAADPKSPLSPFSAESGPARQASVAIFSDVVAGATDLKAPADLREALPELLWLYQMGVVLFWVHDDSPGSAKTYALAERTVPLVVRLIGLARYRLLRGVVNDLLDLVRDLGAPPAGSSRRSGDDHGEVDTEL